MITEEVRIKIEAADASSTLKDVKQSIKDLKDSAVAFGEGTEEFDKLTEKAGELQRKIDDVNEATKLAASEGVFKLGQGFKQLGSKILEGDFKGAADRFKTLSSTIGKVNLKSLISGFKDLGGAVIQMGKALLANPLFLIAAVIIGLIVAVVKLKDSVKFLGEIFDAVGEVIGAVVQALKDFADWLGITSFAADEAAQKNIDNAKAEQEALTTRYEREIQLANIAGEDTQQLELDKQAAIIRTNQIQIDNLNDLISRQHEATDEQKEQLDELVKANDEAQFQITVIQAKAEAERKKAADDAAKEEQKRLDDELKRQQAAAQKAADARAASGKKLAEDNKKLQDDEELRLAESEERRLEIIKNRNIARLQAEFDASNKSKQDAQNLADAKLAIETKYIADVKAIKDQEAADNEAEFQRIYEEELARIQILGDAADEAREEKKKKDKEAADAELALQEALFEAKRNLVDAELGLAQNASNLLKAVAGKNKALAVAAFVIDKAVAAAQVIIAGIRERAALAASYALLGPAGIAPGIIARNISRINTALSLATIAATSIKGVGGGGATTTDSSGGGGGSASGSASGSNGGGSTANIVPNPNLFSTGGNNTNNNNNGSGNGDGERNIGPNAVQAYVLTSNVSSEVERNAMLRRRATFGSTRVE